MVGAIWRIRSNLLSTQLCVSLAWNLHHRDPGRPDVGLRREMNAPGSAPFRSSAPFVDRDRAEFGRFCPVAIGTRTPKEEFASMSWLTFALLSAGFAAATAILAKVGVQGVPSTLATAIRTSFILHVDAGRRGR